MNLPGKVAVVTGGAGGLGRGICFVLADRGADVIVADLAKSDAEKVMVEIQGKGRKSTAYGIDISNRKSVAEMVEDILAGFGKIDILVNCAGVVGAPGFIHSPHTRDEDWDFAFQVNVKGVVIPSTIVGEHMKQRRYGKIGNIASIAGRNGRPNHPQYSSSKAAVINYTQALALDLGPYNINVNTICPGNIWTPMEEPVASRMGREDPDLQGLSPREVFNKVFLPRIPLGREQTPEDIGKAVAFLVSEDARNITGQALNVDGGRVMN